MENQQKRNHHPLKCGISILQKKNLGTQPVAACSGATCPTGPSPRAAPFSPIQRFLDDPGPQVPKKTMERSTILRMGESTISTGPCSIAMLVYQRLNLEIYNIIYNCNYFLVGGIPTPLKNDGVRQLG